jgi:glycosyltransferase involved in cell wall biosynthesis
MSSIKNIIIIYPSFERGGVENILLNLINFFCAKRKKTYLISNINPYKKINNMNNFLILEKISKFNFKGKLNRVVLSILAIKKLKGLMKTLNKKETIIYSMQSNIFPIIISKIYGYKIVIRNSENPVSSYKYSKNKLYSIITIFFKFLIYRFSDGIITNSKGSRNDLMKITGKKVNIKTIYNPYIKKIKKFQKLQKKNLILSVGRLTEQKDFVTLIKGFSLFIKKNKNYTLNILGDGPNKQMLNSYIKKLKMEKNIFIKGWIKDTKKYFLKAKIFVLSSKYEGLGNVLIDAINYNLPCITTDCKSGPREILISSKGGEFIKIGNYKKLSDKLNFVHQNYNTSLNKTNFAKKRLSRFLITKGCQEHLNYFDECIK